MITIENLALRSSFNCTPNCTVTNSLQNVIPLDALTQSFNSNERKL